jgi:hypothetical protein
VENSRVRYTVVAGDAGGLLRVGPDTGHLTVDHWDDLFPIQHFLLLGTAAEGGGDRDLEEGGVEAPVAQVVVGASDQGLPEQRSEVTLRLGVDWVRWSKSVSVLLWIWIWVWYWD